MESMKDKLCKYMQQAMNANVYVSITFAITLLFCMANVAYAGCRGDYTIYKLRGRSRSHWWRSNYGLAHFATNNTIL